MRPDLLWQAGCAVRQGQVGQMIAIAHARLRITRAQETAWQRMAAEIGRAVEPLAAECTPAPAPPPQDWSGQVALMRREGALLQDAAMVEAAIARMYGQLTPPQKQELDRALHEAQRAMTELAAGG